MLQHYNKILRKSGLYCKYVVVYVQFTLYKR